MAKDAISILSADLGTQEALLGKQKTELAPKLSAAQEELIKSGQEREATQKKLAEAIEPKYKAYESAIKKSTEVEPYVEKELPKSTIQQEPTEQAKETFSSLMAVAMLFGATTRQPMLAAMKNMTGVMQGMKEGNQQRIEAETKEFERNYKQALEANKIGLQNYKNILEKNKNDISAAKGELEIEAMRQKDNTLLATLKHDNLKEAFNMLQAQDKALQNAEEKIITSRIRVNEFIQRQADRKQAAAEKTQAGGKEIFTDPATGKLYHMVNGKIQEISVPEGAKLQKLDGKGKGGVSGAVAGATERVSSSMTLAADALDILGTMPITTTSPIYGQETFTGIFKAPLSVLNQALSDDITQMMRTNMSGVARNLASLETGGAATGLVGLADKIDKGIAIPSGASLAVALNSLAEMRRIVESSARNALSSPNYTDAQKKLIQQNLEFVRNAIPYTQKELNKAILASKGEGIKLKRGEENMTFTEFMKKYPLDDQAKPQPATESVSSTKPQGAPDTARQAKDGKWYSPDPKRPGKYLEWK